MKDSIKITLIMFFITILSFSQNKECYPELIAKHYGESKFESIKSIEFTFNVKKAHNNTVSRHWKWYPKTNKVDFYSQKEVLSFTHNDKVDDNPALDKKFINDSYWLLFPFHLIWDKLNYKYTIEEKVLSPINNIKSNKLTIEYTNGDGYSPNDVYELYLTNNKEIFEWVYRKSGNKTTTLITTWENTENHNGIKISTKHNGKDGVFKVWFENVIIQKN